MKKIITLFTFLSLFIVSCTKTEVVPPTMNERTITISATMPTGEESRVNYAGGTSEQRSITLKWETTDKLMLCFVHNGKYYHKEATIVSESISQDGKKANFKIEVPKEIPAEASFTLHAIYQQTVGENDNGGYFKENTAEYVFEDRENWRITLKNSNTEENNLSVIRPTLVSTQKNVTATTLGNLSFQHLGWVMAVHLQNNTGEEQSLPKYLLFQNDENPPLWNGAHDAYSVNINLDNDQIESNDITKKHVINFYISSPYSPYKGKTIKNGETIVFYRWLLKTDYINDMEAYILLNNTNFITAPAIILPHKKVKPGTVYHVYLKWSDGKIESGK